MGSDGAPVFLRDIWPSTEEVDAVVASSVKPEMFRNTYSTISTSNPMWNKLAVRDCYLWDLYGTVYGSSCSDLGSGKEKPCYEGATGFSPDRVPPVGEIPTMLSTLH